MPKTKKEITLWTKSTQTLRRLRKIMLKRKRRSITRGSWWRSTQNLRNLRKAQEQDIWTTSTLPDTVS